MLNRSRGLRRTTLGLTLAGALLLSAGVLSAGPTAAAASVPPAVGDEVTATDGHTLSIGAIDPPSRTSGLVAIYTPSFGSTTKTNQFGGEAVLSPGDAPGEYIVDSVCTVLATCAEPEWTPGDNSIPADGLVLSVSPGATPDVRLFLRDHVAAGDVLTIDSVISRSASTEIDIVDPNAENNPAGVDADGECFPGCRGAEQLVQYTPASDRATTGTNDYGYEVVVRDGVVVSSGGNDQAIPADGYVLSGHGSRGTWLQTNAVVGASIDITDATLTATIDEHTVIYGAQQALQVSTTRIDDAIGSCLAFPEGDARTAADLASQKLAEAETAAAAGDAATAVALAEEAMAAAELAGYRTAESRPAEGRATWVRPEETTPEAIDVTLDRLDDAGFNMIFLETIFQGYTIFPSDAAAASGVAAQRPNMVGFDPLQVWIDGAHERGIEVHPWIHTFYVGADQVGGPGPVLSVHPEWAAIQRQDVGKEGLHPSIAEPGYYFLDAAVPEARDYVQSLLQELMGEYDIDGLHLDYIRYPVSLPWETAGYSYSDYSRAVFEDAHGVDPYTLTPADAAWETWTQWRVENITSFVGEVRDMQQELLPEGVLSAAVFADPSDGLDKKLQDWGDWADRGYLDVMTGMTFGTSASSVGADTAVMRERVGEESLLYTATYSPFRGSTPETMLAQMQSVIDAGSDGGGLFAFNQLSNAQAAALAEGAHRTQAIAPHADPIEAAKVGIQSLRDSVDAAAGDCLPAKTANSVIKRLDTAVQVLDRSGPHPASAILGTVEGMLGAPDETGPAAFVERTQRDLTMYLRWLSTAAAEG